MAQSPATSLTLAEEGGATLELRDRALPYRPMTISGRQRIDTTWYPGNPVATVQMLGPEEGNITLRGYWKDRFIQGTGAAQYATSGQSFVLAQAVAVADVTTFAVPNVSDLVTIVDNMRRMGRRIKFTWDRIVRVGHIASFEQTWHNAHDVEWSLEFAVVSQGEEQASSASANPTNLADQAAIAASNAEIAALAAVSVLPASLTVLEQINAGLTAFEDAANKASQAIYDAASGVAAWAAVGPNAARRIAAACSGMVVSSAQTLGTITDRALSDAVEFGAYGGQDNCPLGVQISAANVQRSWHNAVTSIKYNNALSRYEIESQLQQELRASFIAPNDMDLRDVSTRYYGNPNDWKALKEFNGFPDSKLRAGTLVWVPMQPTGGSAGLTQGGSV